MAGWQWREKKERKERRERERKREGGGGGESSHGGIRSGTTHARRHTPLAPDLLAEANGGVGTI